jgi:hypothetical protein
MRWEKILCKFEKLFSLRHQHFSYSFQICFPILSERKNINNKPIKKKIKNFFCMFRMFFICSSNFTFASKLTSNYAISRNAKLVKSEGTPQDFNYKFANFFKKFIKKTYVYLNKSIYLCNVKR